MSIGSVLKPNNLFYQEVQWLPTEKELNFCFCVVNKYGARGEDERPESKVFVLLFVALTHTT